LPELWGAGRETRKGALQMHNLWARFQGVRFTEEELKKYWIARCPECGWRSLSRDCDGFAQIADTGDYDNGLCPICKSVIDDEDDVPKRRLLWIWRSITMWPVRKVHAEMAEIDRIAKNIQSMAEEN